MHFLPLTVNLYHHRSKDKIIWTSGMWYTSLIPVESDDMHAVHFDNKPDTRHVCTYNVSLMHFV